MIKIRIALLEWATCPCSTLNKKKKYECTESVKVLKLKRIKSKVSPKKKKKHQNAKSK